MIGTMSCQEFVEEVTKYREGELGFARRMNFVVHKAMCVHCRGYYNQLVRVSTELRRLRQQSMTPEERADYIKDLLEKARNAPESEDLSHLEAGGVKPEDS